jgi:hypothetical protein
MATDVILLDSISTLVIPVSKAAFPIIERQPIECSPRFEVVDITLKINAILLTFNSLQDCGACRQRSKSLLTTTRPWVDRSHLGEKLLALGSSPRELPTLRLVLILV